MNNAKVGQVEVDKKRRHEMYLAIRRYLTITGVGNAFLNGFGTEEDWRTRHSTEELSDLIIFGLMETRRVPDRIHPPPYFTDAQKVAFNNEQEAIYNERKRLWDEWRHFGLNPENEDAGGLPVWMLR